MCTVLLKIHTQPWQARCLQHKAVPILLVYLVYLTCSIQTCMVVIQLYCQQMTQYQNEPLWSTIQYTNCMNVWTTTY